MDGGGQSKRRRVCGAADDAGGAAVVSPRGNKVFVDGKIKVWPRLRSLLRALIASARAQRMCLECVPHKYVSYKNFSHHRKLKHSPSRRAGPARAMPCAVSVP